MTVVTYIWLVLGVCGLFHSSFALHDSSLCGSDIAGRKTAYAKPSTPTLLDPQIRNFRFIVPSGENVCQIGSYAGVEVTACDFDSPPIVKFEAGSDKVVQVTRTGSLLNYGSVETTYYCL